VIIIIIIIIIIIQKYNRIIDIYGEMGSNWSRISVHF
jgi:hypothetical protein